MDNVITMVKSVKEQAKEKISKEINEYDNLARANGISCIMPTEERAELENFLFNCIEKQDGFAENVLKEEKSIVKGLSWCGNKIPLKLKELKMAMIDNQTVFEWFAEYFEVDEEAERAKEKEKRKAEAEARKKKSSPADVKKAKEEADRRIAEAKAAAEAKAEAEARKKMGVYEGQLDLFSMMAPSTASVSFPVEPAIPVNDAPITVTAEGSDVEVDIDDDDIALPFNINDIYDDAEETKEEPSTDESEEDALPLLDDEDDLLPWEEGEDNA